jgi:hypothetical protein
MPRFGFLGPNYQSASPLVSAEQLINWYFERAESANARTPGLLLPMPGLSLDADLSTIAGAVLPSVRGSLTTQGRTFFVAGTHLFERQASGAYVDYGGFAGNNHMVDDGLPVTMVAGGTVGGSYPTQVLICSGGALTVFSLVSNTFQALTTPPANNLMVEFQRGFFLALQSGNTWSVSNAEDATTWPGISVAQVSVFSDQLLAIKESNDLVWLFGAQRAVAYYNSGAPLFPFDVANGSFMEVGIVAQYSVARVTLKSGTTLAWLGGDERGGPVVYFANGFVPTKVSDSALDYWLAQQSEKGITLSDAVGIPWQYEGHNFYSLWFPTANRTWTLDSDSLWWWQTSSLIGGQQVAHRMRCHTQNFGIHFVGGRNTAQVFKMSSLYTSENTGVGVFTPIVRTRIGPTVSIEGGQITVPINEFQVDFETGLGPQPPLTDGVGNPRDPVAMFSYSEDFGKTWTPERLIPCGQAGQQKVAAIDRRLGSWRSWTPKVTVSDAIQWRIADAFFDSTQSSVERWAKKMAAVS